MMIAQREDGGYRHLLNGDLPNIKTRDEDETRMERKRDVVIGKMRLQQLSHVMDAMHRRNIQTLTQRCLSWIWWDMNCQHVLFFLIRITPTP